jgi:hypothetical protein
MSFLQTFIQHSRQPVRRAQNRAQPVEPSAAATGLGITYPVSSAPDTTDTTTTHPIPDPVDALSGSRAAPQPIPQQVADTAYATPDKHEEHVAPSQTNPLPNVHKPTIGTAPVSAQTAIAQQVQPDVGEAFGHQVDPEPAATPVPNQEPTKPGQKPLFVPNPAQTTQQSIQPAQLTSNEGSPEIEAKTKNNQPAAPAQQAATLESATPFSEANQPATVNYPGDNQAQPVAPHEMHSGTDNVVQHPGKPEQAEPGPSKPDAIRMLSSPVDTAHYAPPAANNARIQTAEIPQVRIKQINVLVEDQAAQQKAAAKRPPAHARSAATNPFGLRGL